MFHATREGFAAAWRRARERGTLRLFLFEFTVVLLGVLAAQAVQSWAQEREARQHAEEERVRLEQGFVSTVQAAAVWRAALPCLQERVGDIMRAAGSGASVGSDMARRPKLVQGGYVPASPENYALIEEAIGSKRASALSDVQIRAATIEAAQAEIRSEWELFRLLDPDFGRASVYDRATAREAGAAILTRLRSIEFALDMIETERPLVTAEDATPFDPVFDILPVRSCQELWANGTAYRKLDPGEAPPW